MESQATTVERQATGGLTAEPQLAGGPSTEELAALPRMAELMDSLAAVAVDAPDAFAHYKLLVEALSVPKRHPRPRNAGSAVTPTKKCGQCGAINPTARKICSACGSYIIRKARPPRLRQRSDSQQQARSDPCVARAAKVCPACSGQNAVLALACSSCRVKFSVSQTAALASRSEDKPTPVYAELEPQPQVATGGSACGPAVSRSALLQLPTGLQAVVVRDALADLGRTVEASAAATEWLRRGGMEQQIAQELASDPDLAADPLRKFAQATIESTEALAKAVRDQMVVLELSSKAVLDVSKAELEAELHRCRVEERELLLSLSSAEAEGLQSGTESEASDPAAEADCFCGTDRHLPTSSLPFEGAWVACDSCDRWCHGECVGLSKAEAEQLQHFVCPPCEAAAEGGQPKALRLPASDTAAVKSSRSPVPRRTSRRVGCAAPVARATLTRYGREVLGRRVRIFWPEEDAWYSGRVKDVSLVDDTHYVLYDDGETRWEPLSTVLWELYPASSPDDAAGTRPSAPGRAAARQQAAVAPVVLEAVAVRSSLAPASLHPDEIVEAIVCDGCDGEFELPPGTTAPEGEWFCAACGAGARDGAERRKRPRSSDGAFGSAMDVDVVDGFEFRSQAGPAMDVDVVDGFEFRSHACSKIAATLLGCKLVSRPCGNQK